METQVIAKDQIAYLSQWQLIKLRFLKHKLAIWALSILIILYFIAFFVEIIAPYTSSWRDVDHAYCPPQIVRFSFKNGLYVYPMRIHIDPVSLQKSYIEDKKTYIPLGFFVKGEPYKLWKLIPMNRHLFGVNKKKYNKLYGGVNKKNYSKLYQGKTQKLEISTFYILGADKFGRDLFSRILYGARISLSIGIIGIALSFILGLTIGGISGYLSGKVDLIIQRAIEILNAIPKLPLWLALGAALPADWSPLKVYFAITILLSLLGWTGLARVVRGKILSLREEDYAVAAKLLGANHRRIIFRHLIPGFTSHIIVSLSLSVPRMILGETSLSFLGLGLRPPVVSWGVMLQDCMNMQAVALYPWLLIPAVFITLTVLCYNFLGDGIRDAADPYA